MDIVVRIHDRNNVTEDRVSSFIRELASEGFISESGIDWISYDHYDPLTNSRVGESYNVNTTDEAINVISSNGVEYLGIGFKYTDHYHIDGRPSNLDHMSSIMYSLNVASAEAAKQLEEDSGIDFYMPVKFSSGLYHTEWGEEEVCELSLGGEGYIDEENIESHNKIIETIMDKECPEFASLLNVVQKHFGDSSMSLRPPEF